jgi:lysylphosphatidylglycerol synthetase-like protein (DUF2156 family)
MSVRRYLRGLGVALVIAAALSLWGGHARVSIMAIAAAGVLLLRAPAPMRTTPSSARLRAAELVEVTENDPLAPFALRSDKAYVFSPDNRAAIGYRMRLGVAVVGGDPVGDAAAFTDVVEVFCALARRNGWRIAVLGVSERCLPLWRAVGLRPISIGRDVVLDVEKFNLEGRKYRNLRQAIQRTYNAGITTEIMSERALPRSVRDELRGIIVESRGDPTGRGFSMVLDHLLMGSYENTYLAIARDQSGRAVAFQRYALAGYRRDVSLDTPWRIVDAPNGVDERLTYDTLIWAREQGAVRMSLAFGAFPELFALEHRDLFHKALYKGVHQLDRYIKLETLYRYLKKFHAFGPQRYVALHPTQVVSAAMAMLSLEFGISFGRSIED